MQHPLNINYEPDKARYHLVTQHSRTPDRHAPAVRPDHV